MTLANHRVVHSPAFLSGLAALALLAPLPCAALQPPTSAPADTRCEAMTSVRPVPANDHAINDTDYPLLSLANGEAGNVILDLRIKTDGTVDDVKIARSSGFAELDGAAVDAVSGHWRYKPVTSDGHPIACRHLATIAWRIPLNPGQFAGYGYAVVQMQRSGLPSDPVTPKSAEPITGMVLTIGKDGSIIHEHVLHASGYPDLDRVALAAARNGQWHVTPASLDGKPLRSNIGLLVVWTR